MAASPSVAVALVTAALLQGLAQAQVTEVKTPRGEVPPCATVGKAYGDLIPSGGAAEDAYLCQMNCQAVSEVQCSYFTYFPETKACWFAGSVNNGTMRTREGAIGGPRRCLRPSAEAVAAAESESTTLASVASTTQPEVAVPTQAPAPAPAPVTVAPPQPAAAATDVSTAAPAEAVVTSSPYPTVPSAGKYTTTASLQERMEAPFQKLVGEKYATVAFVALCVAGAGLLVLCCACCCGKKGERTIKKPRAKRGVSVPVEVEGSFDEEVPSSPSTEPLVAPPALQHVPQHPEMVPMQQVAYSYMPNQHHGYQQAPQVVYSHPGSWQPAPMQASAPASYIPMPGAAMPAVGLTPPVIAPSFFNLA